MSYAQAPFLSYLLAALLFASPIASVLARPTVHSRFYRVCCYETPASYSCNIYDCMMHAQSSRFTWGRFSIILKFSYSLYDDQLYSCTIVPDPGDPLI